MPPPKGYIEVELRGKRGRKHVVLYRYLAREGDGYVYTPAERPTGLVCWYYRRHGDRWKSTGHWFSFYPERDVS